MEMRYFSAFVVHLYLFFVQTLAQNSTSLRRNQMAFPVPLSCTPTCKELQDIKDSPDVLCSCSSSCVVYGDCCRDAPYQNSGSDRNKLGCLPLSNLGPVSVVDSCSMSSRILSEACKTGLGTSVPVTSKDTGTSYANYYCALCNKDSFNLFDWPVKFRCCEQDIAIIDNTVSIDMDYDANRNILWSVSKLKNGSRVFCQCEFYAQNDDLSFTKTLELRQCQKEEISICSLFWNTESTRKGCEAYLDPVYSGNKVYRNRHCATCNYESGEELKCSTDVFNPMLISPARLLAFCKSRNISNCSNYFRAKGHPISFSQLFSMKEKQCVPPNGRMCCEGQRYDRYLKKCRELPTHVVL